MKVGKIFISFVAIFLLVGGFLLFQATRAGASSVLSPSEVLRQGGNLNRIRIAGKVAALPIQYSVAPSIKLSFSVEDPAGASTPIPVIYENLKPDMFAEGRSVLIDGEYRDGVLYASSLLTQCPSKYEPKDPEAVKSHGVE